MHVKWDRRCFVHEVAGDPDLACVHVDDVLDVHACAAATRTRLPLSSFPLPLAGRNLLANLAMHVYRELRLRPSMLGASLSNLQRRRGHCAMQSKSRSVVE